MQIIGQCLEKANGALQIKNSLTQLEIFATKWTAKRIPTNRDIYKKGKKWKEFQEK